MEAVPSEVTRRALEAYESLPDPRLRRLVQGLIEHLHACVRDLGLTLVAIERVNGDADSPEP